MELLIFMSVKISPVFLQNDLNFSATCYFFRSGLVYICLACVLWIVYLQIFDHASLVHWVSCFSMLAANLNEVLFFLKFNRKIMYSFLVSFHECDPWLSRSGSDNSLVRVEVQHTLHL